MRNNEGMKLYFAPMEGITSALYRQTHAELFTPADKYFAPFIAPNGDGSFKLSQLRDLQMERNSYCMPVPQVLCNSPEPFVAVAYRLYDLGYSELNLNVGCPSATVVSKHKGAGMLSDLDSLRRCLDGIFSACPVKVSVKTRMGLLSTEELPQIMQLYKDYPISELIIHARARAGMYHSEPDIKAFISEAKDCPFPLCYNGNIFTEQSYYALLSAGAAPEAVMIGRGALANPALFRQLKGGAELTRGELMNFHNTLLERLLSAMDEHYVLSHMKELWYYIRSLFPEAERELKQINKALKLSDYKSAVSTIFSYCDFCPEQGFIPPEKAKRT